MLLAGRRGGTLSCGSQACSLPAPWPCASTCLLPFPPPFIPRSLFDYLWVAEDGMKMQGYNGSQLWDTAFAVQARAMLVRCLLRLLRSPGLACGSEPAGWARMLQGLPGSTGLVPPSPSSALAAPHHSPPAWLPASLPRRPLPPRA